MKKIKEKQMFAVELWGDLFQKVALRANGILRTECGVWCPEGSASGSVALPLSRGHMVSFQYRVARGGTLIYLEERFSLVEELAFIEIPFRLP